MRVLGLKLDATGSFIQEFARVDVTTDPVLGCRVERLMSSRYDPLTSRLGPFAGRRLESAIWDPRPADILVSAAPDTACALPDGTTGELPWIHVLKAWCRLVSLSPSNLLDLCWHRGSGRFSDATGPAVSGHEVALMAKLLVAMLETSPPAELVAHSAQVG